MKPLTICIGYDTREPIALQVCAHSIIRRASGPVSIIPLALSHLKLIYARPPNGTTEFSLTRFLTPYLSGYKGFSIFMDCDMIVKTDIYGVMEHVNVRDDVSVCQHDYTPVEGAKATGIQTAYPRKNWSSFMVFNNERCWHLDPQYVNTASPSDLHRLGWADRTGSLPLEWNWLVGEYPHNDNAKVLHYTLGTPCFPKYIDCDHADDWWAEYDEMRTPMTFKPQLYAVAAAAGYPVPPRTSR